MLAIKVVPYFILLSFLTKKRKIKKEEKMTRLERRLAQTMQILMLIANQSGRKSFLPAEIDLFNLLLFLNIGQIYLRKMKSINLLRNSCEMTK